MNFLKSSVIAGKNTKIKYNSPNLAKFTFVIYCRRNQTCFLKECQSLNSIKPVGEQYNHHEIQSTTDQQAALTVSVQCRNPSNCY